MTTGFRLTLLCLMMLCLVLCLTQPAEFEHLLPIVGAGSWFAPHTESATDALTVSVARSMQSSARGINDLPPPTNGRFVTWLDWQASIAIRPRPTNLWFVYPSRIISDQSRSRRD